jgi:cytochrome P450
MEPVFVEDRGWVVSRYRQVATVLDDPTFLVPAAEPAESGVGWLRSSASRFANGAEHARRREQVEALLHELDPAALRAEATVRTNAALDGARDGTVDVMSALARRVPLSVLAEAIGIHGDVTALVQTAAPAYPPGAEAEAERRADDAVEQLVAQLGGRDNAVDTQLTLLVQTCDATAGLIGNSLSIGLRLEERPGRADGLLAETLRWDPPVRGTRRVATTECRIGDTTIERGSTVALDFAAANRDPDVFADPDEFQPGRKERSMTFGHGFRACPGSDHAFALAAGVVEPVLARCEPGTGELAYEPSPLRIPAALPVAVR